MALTEQTDLGLMSADSYISVASADSWLSLSSKFLKWNGLALDVKEKYLVAATKFMDAFFVWYGTPLLAAPGTRWPRDKVKDADGRVLTAIPEMVRLAAAEIGLYFVINDPFLDSGSYGISEMELDVLKIKFSDGTASKVKLPQSIIDRLRPFGYPIFSQETVMRRSSRVIAS